jgi:hypothetical protein
MQPPFGIQPVTYAYELQQATWREKSGDPQGPPDARSSEETGSYDARCGALADPVHKTRRSTEREAHSGALRAPGGHFLVGPTRYRGADRVPGKLETRCQGGTVVVQPWSWTPSAASSSLAGLAIAAPPIHGKDGMGRPGGQRLPTNKLAFVTPPNFAPDGPA